MSAYMVGGSFNFICHFDWGFVNLQSDSLAFMSYRSTLQNCLTNLISGKLVFFLADCETSQIKAPRNGVSRHSSQSTAFWHRWSEARWPICCSCLHRVLIPWLEAYNEQFSDSNHGSGLVCAIRSVYETRSSIMYICLVQWWIERSCILFNPQKNLHVNCTHLAVSIFCDEVGDWYSVLWPGCVRLIYLVRGREIRYYEGCYPIGLKKPLPSKPNFFGAKTRHIFFSTLPYSNHSLLRSWTQFLNLLSMCKISWPNWQQAIVEECLNHRSISVRCLVLIMLGL